MSQGEDKADAKTVNRKEIDFPEHLRKARAKAGKGKLTDVGPG